MYRLRERCGRALLIVAVAVAAFTLAAAKSGHAIADSTSGASSPFALIALNDDPSCSNHTLLVKLGGTLKVSNGIYVNSCNQGDAFDIFGGGSISAPRISTVGGWETHDASKVNVPDGTLCSFPPNKAPNWHVTPTTPGYNPTPAGCPDVGQPPLIDPFASFPPAPDLGPGNVGVPMNITKVSRGLNGDASGIARVVTASPHNLNVGDSVTISGVGFGFDGAFTVASVLNATTFTYSNAGPTLPVITYKQMSGGVATMTTNAPTTLAVGEGDLSVVGLPGFNVTGATVTGAGSTSFSYQPPPFTLSITKKQLQSGTATLTAASTAGLDPGDTVNISGVGAQFDGVGQTVTAVPNATTFKYADSATTTLTVTQKAAAHGVATLTAANNLSVGDTVTVNIGDARFDGTYTVSAATGTQFSYADPNLGTMDITATNKVMASGVATITVGTNHLAVGDPVTVNIPDVNYTGGPYTVSALPLNAFSYTPAVPVPLTTGSISGRVATVTTSVAHELLAGDDVKVAGDEAYRFTGSASNVALGTPAGTTFSYTPTPVTNVAWNVTSSTSATFTTPGTHDTNITSVTIGGTVPAYLSGKTFSGANLVVTSNGFTVKGTGFFAGNSGTIATVTINTAGATTFSGALATTETAWDLASRSVTGTVTVPLFLAATAASGTVTAPGFVAANTAVSPAGSATVTDVPTLAASGTFSPAWMPALGGIISQNFPGSPGIPSPVKISTGTQTLSPGTYYGGICIGAPAGSDCGTNSVPANCKAAVGTTTTIQSYSPKVHLAVAIGNADATGVNTTIQVDTAGVIGIGDVIAIDNEEMLVTGVSGTTISVTRGYNGTEDAAHTAGTEIQDVVTKPNGTAYNPAVKLSAAIDAVATTIPVNTSAPVGVGDTIQIDSEAMTVTGILDGTHLTVTRGTFNTTPAAHASNAPVLKVFDASVPPPPSVTLTKGIYIMAGGGFNVCGAANVNAPNGVMIYNTNDPTHPGGYGALGQVDINTSGVVHLKPMPDGTYAGMTIFQDRSLTLVAGANCGGKSVYPSQWDIALQSAAPLPVSEELGSISGTIYAPHLGADFEDSMSGTANLAIVTSCILINSANSTFNFAGGAPFTTPSVTTQAATNVGSSTATLNSTVNPNGSDTIAHFDWGTSTSYGSTTASMDVGSGSSSTPFNADLAGLAAGTTFHFRVVATSAGGTTYGVDESFTTPAASTTLTPAAANGTYGGTATLSATLTSGGSGVAGKTVTFTVNGSSVGSATTDSNGVAALNNVSLAGLDAGSYAIDAAYAGDSTYLASNGSSSLTVSKADQSILITQHAPSTAAVDDQFTVSATGGGSGNAIVYGSSGSCTNSDATYTITHTGSCTVTYDQAGDSNYNAAPELTESVNSTKADQTINVSTHAPSSAVYGTDFTVAATGGASGNPITYGSLGACTNTGADFTMTSGTGTCTVTYNQAGDSNYNAATQVSEPVTAEKGDQTITFATPADRTYGDANFDPSATASSGDAVSYSASGSCSIVNGTVHLTAAGSCTVTASQPGDTNYNPAPPVQRMFSAGKAALSITANDRQTFYDQPLTLGTTAFTSSGLVGSDSISGVTLTSAGAAPGAAHGNYPIVPSQAVAGPNTDLTGNYTITYQNGTLHVLTVGIIGLTGVSVTTNAGKIDSFDSSLGAYSSTNRSHAALVMSNGLISFAGVLLFGSAISTQGSVSVANTASLSGDVTAGTTASIQGLVAGTVTQNSPSNALSAQTVAACTPFSPRTGISGGLFSYSPSTGNFAVKGGTVKLANGTYCFHNVSLVNGATLSVSGPVTIHLTGKITGVGLLANTTNVPANLHIDTSYTGSNGVVLTGDKHAYVTIVAPATGVTLSGGAFFGTVFAGTVSLTHGTKFHADIH